MILLEQILTADSAGQRVNVLLDAGALVIDMSNEAIAWKWLQAPLKDGVPNECNWKLRHYKHGEWTFGSCKLDVAESISERVVWNESIDEQTNQ